MIADTPVTAKNILAELGKMGEELQNPGSGKDAARLLAEVGIVDADDFILALMILLMSSGYSLMRSESIAAGFALGLTIGLRLSANSKS